MPAKVIVELCRGCGNCARRCPEGAIKTVGGTAVSARDTQCYQRQGRLIM